MGIYSFILGVIFVVVFYNISSVLKNSYLLIKNRNFNDDKYLAVITENGLWIKDEVDENINIINANKVDNEFLLDVSITQLNKNFDVLNIISDKVNISSNEWIIIEPQILENNQTTFASEVSLYLILI